MHPRSAGAGYRPQLDGIRAVAVVMVVLFHLGFEWIPGGFIGVDVFFVLSGYLITGLLLGEATRSGGVRLRRFYARRVRRLLPASLLVLAAVLVVGLALLDVVQRQSLGNDAGFAALYSANWRFATVGGDYFAPGDVPSPLVHFWSLAVEEQFYLVWPAAFVVLFRVSTRRRGGAALGGLLGAIVALALASAVASVALVGSPVTYYGTHTRAYQLLAGAALSVAAHRWSLRFPASTAGRRGAAILALAALAGLAALAHLIPDATGYPGGAGLLVTAASLGLVVGLDLAPPGPSNPVVAVLGHGIPAALGRLSYSLYVWHWPVVVFLPVLATRWGNPSVSSRPVLVLVMLVLSGGSYLAVERPVRFRLRPSAPAGAVVAVGLTLSIVVGVSALGAYEPLDGFRAEAAAAVRDLAKPGRCPYFPDEWGDPDTSEPCVYRQGAGPVIAIVGDSHAQQWQSAMERLAVATDATIIRATRGGCPANDITANAADDTGRRVADTDCTAWRHRVYPAVARARPDVVFVATRSHVRSITVDDRSVAPTDPDHLALWSKGWDWTLRTLSARGARVVVSLIAPTLPRRVPACLIDHGRTTRRCDFVAGDDRVVVPYNHVVVDLPRRFPGVRVVDLTPVGCPAGRCPAIMGGVIVHRDDNHLSATFVRNHTAQFAQRLAAVGVRL